MDAISTRHEEMTPAHFPLEGSADHGWQPLGASAQSHTRIARPAAPLTDEAHGAMMAGISETTARRHLAVAHGLGAPATSEDTPAILEHRAWGGPLDDTGPVPPEDRAIPLTAREEVSYLLRGEADLIAPAKIENPIEAEHEETVETKASGPAAAFTRVFDIAVAMLAIIAFFPLLVMVACAIRASGPGPVIFIQRRVGHAGGLFPCLKFRSMVINSQEVLDRLLAECPRARAEWARDQKLRSDPRITPVGALLRKSSLDELPQLFNVLFGHMSIVGPRPIVEAEIARYGSRFDAYCSVRPGLTGLWQVSGRNEVSYEARVRLDARYAQRKSLFYDMAICLRTVPAVLGSRGCY